MDNIDELRRLADGGDPSAQFTMSYVYTDPKRNTTPDYASAAGWMAKAATSGCPDAAVSMAFFLDRGMGVDQNPAEAFRLYQAAALQGHQEAYYWVATMYRDGRGVRKSAEQALVWYLADARRGSAESQVAIGNLYMEGRDVPQDFVEGYAWLIVATTNSSGFYQGNRDQALQKLSPDQVGQAQQRAKVIFQELQ